MTEIMTAPEMTDGQIENALSKLRDAMRKHRSGISSDVAQRVLGVENLGMILFAPFRERAEAESKTVTRSAPINRTRTPMEALKATGRVPYVNEAVAIAMPLCSGDHVEMMFVNLGRAVACNKLDSELEKMGYELIVDPVGLAGINEDDLAFADTHPNGTQWKDADGNYCCAVFNRWRGERFVNVDRHVDGWDDDWWFSVRRK